MDNAARHGKTERIGRMDQQITVQSFTESVNAYGERVESWTTAATVWAAVAYNTVTSDEREQAGQEQVQRVVTFTIRDRAMDEKYRVLYDSRYYDIESISRSNDRQYLTLECRQIDQ